MSPRLRNIAHVLWFCAMTVMWPSLAVAKDAKPSAKRIALLYQDARIMPQIKAFQEAMGALGLVAGDKVQYEHHIAWPGRDDLDLTAETMVHSRPDLIFAIGTPPAVAARKATATLPILFYVSNPVGTGLADNLAHPGGNATGIASLAEELSAKRLELLKEAAPNVHRVAVLANPTNPATKQQLDALDVAAHTLGIRITVLNAGTVYQLGKALRRLQRKRFDGALLIGDVVLNARQKEIAAAALKAGIPTISPFEGYARQGGLMSYGPSYREVLQRCAAYAERMLKGTPPADLPIEQVSRFKLSVNLTTAKRLGLTLPESIHIRIDDAVR